MKSLKSRISRIEEKEPISAPEPIQINRVIVTDRHQVEHPELYKIEHIRTKGNRTLSKYVPID